jgi:hypothetical protein
MDLPLFSLRMMVINSAMLLLPGKESVLKSAIIVLSIALAVFFWSNQGISCDKTYHLFVIERSTNKNIVQYDVCIEQATDIHKVRAYWVLENGREESLNPLEKKFAYGVSSQDKIDNNRSSILVAAFKERQIVVEKVGNLYRAIVRIAGENSILERVYIQCEKGWTGMPKVKYVDLFGFTKRTRTPINERIVPQ